jgi:sugar lactone lactonase YvrE
MRKTGRFRQRRGRNLAAFPEKVLQRLFLVFVSFFLVLPGRLLAQNPLYRLEEVERIGAGVLRGPEDVARDEQGNVYTGCADGVVYRISPSGEISPFADTGGRPLGLFRTAEGTLLVCDAKRRELLAITPDGGIRVLADSAGGRPFFFPDDVWAAGDGTVYFTDATTYRYGQEIKDLVRGEPLGRLIRVRPGGTAEVLKGDLSFPNGVTLSRDDQVLYLAEMARMRILKIPLAGEKQGETEVFADNLPGFVDGISVDADGNLLAAIPAIAEKSRRRVASLPGWFRRLLSHLPPALLPSADEEGMLLLIRPDGTVIPLLWDPRGTTIPHLTNVIDAGDACYLGFLEPGAGIGKFRRSEQRERK